VSAVIARLAATGRVAEALSLLRQVARPSPELKALRSELEWFSGNRDVALRLADEVSVSGGSAKAVVRSLAVSGRLNLFAGRTGVGQQQFLRARELAQTDQDPGLLAYATGMHLETLLRFVGLEGVVGEIGKYRRVAFRAGNHRSLGQLHKVLAEAELKSGHGRRALRELELCALHVNAAQDTVLETQLDFARGAAFGSMGQLGIALECAERAVSSARGCGASAIERAALVNVAHLQVIMGLHADAERTLEELTRHQYSSVDRELDVRNNQLELLVARRDEDAVNVDAIWGPVADGRTSVPAQWFKSVRISFLTSFGRLDEAVELGRKCLELSSRDDRDYLARTRCSTAEAMAILGVDAACIEMVDDVVLKQFGALPEFIALTQRVSGLLTSDTPKTAFEHFSRSARVFGHIGHVVGCGESLHAAARLRARIDSGSDANVPHITTFYTRAPASFGRIDSDDTVVDASPEFIAASAVRAAAAMVDLASKPMLAAYELVTLVMRTGVAGSAVIVAGEGKRREVVGWAGGAEPDARLSDPTAATVSVAFGAEGATAISVVLAPRNQRSARTTLMALQRLVGHAITLQQAAQAESEKSALWPEPLPEQQLGLVCSAESMLELMKVARRLASSNIPVLITGETGTGKELLAHALHNVSPRSNGRFLPFNCTAVPREMLDSQLFGYRRGAFTGANDAFPGVIRGASGGTLFLDEIGEISPEVQPKLLRFLESAEVHPLGESAPVPVDVRIVAATNANLDALVAQGRFREDLYYRLNVVKLTIPPLRERREEIPVLVEHFLMRSQKEAGKAGIRVGDTAAEYLLLYDWPGNVRELVNEMRRAVALAEPGAVLMPEHFSPRLAATRRTVPAGERPPTPSELLVRRDQPLSAAVEHVERALILDALRRHVNVEDAARSLGLSRKGLYLKRQRLQIDPQLAEA
jgi:DNA-binding NtrC family response regulator